MKIGMCACGSMNCQYCSSLPHFGRPYMPVQDMPNTNTASKIMNIEISLEAIFRKLDLLEKKIDALGYVGNDNAT